MSWSELEILRSCRSVYLWDRLSPHFTGELRITGDGRGMYQVDKGKFLVKQNSLSHPFMCSPWEIQWWTVFCCSLIGVACCTWSLRKYWIPAVHMPLVVRRTGNNKRVYVYVGRTKHLEGAYDFANWHFHFILLVNNISHILPDVFESLPGLMVAWLI